jgi:hypothetical protein
MIKTFTPTSGKQTIILLSRKWCFVSNVKISPPQTSVGKTVVRVLWMLTLGCQCLSSPNSLFCREMQLTESHQIGESDVGKFWIEKIPQTIGRIFVVVKLRKKKKTVRRLMVLIAWKAYVDQPESSRAWIQPGWACMWGRSLTTFFYETVHCSRSQVT